jgi:Uma2 family endonuclease
MKWAASRSCRTLPHSSSNATSGMCRKHTLDRPAVHRPPGDVLGDPAAPPFGYCDTVIEPGPAAPYGAPMASQRLSRSEFHSWAADQPKGRFERVSGTPVAMAPERWVHARLKARIWRALDREIRASGLSCEAAPDGMTVEIDDDTDYEPDALVNCGDPIPDEATAAPNPVVIVEVLSPRTEALDAGGKLADYFRLPSLRQYLLVRPLRREIIQHSRVGERIETRIIRSDCVELDPPGIQLSLDEIYGD